MLIWTFAIIAAKGLLRSLILNSLSSENAEPATTRNDDENNGQEENKEKSSKEDRRRHKR